MSRNSLWSHLQDRGSFLAIKSDWEPFFSILSKAKKGIFVPIKPAQSLPCDNRQCLDGCSIEVQEYGNGYRGICPKRVFSPRSLTHEDVLLYELKAEMLHARLAEAFVLTHAHSKLDGAVHTFGLGRSAPLYGEPKGHYVSYAPTEIKLKSAVLRAAVEESGKSFVFWIPTPKFLTSDLKAVAVKAGANIKVLSEEVILNDDGTFETSSALLKEPTAEYRVLKRFPTPPNCTWEQITIEFVNNDEVEISANGTMGGRFTFADMGMKNHKKKGLEQHSLQWTVLKSFSEINGSMPMKRLPQKVQKQKQKLSQQLRDFFSSIEGEPIISLNGHYECRFTIRPHTNVARKTSMVEMEPEADDDFWASYQSQDLYRP